MRRLRGVRVLLMSAMAATALAGAMLAAPPALAQPFGSYFTFFNDNSGWCLGITSNGLAGQFSCTEANDQEWQWGPEYSTSPGTTGYGYYQLYNYANVGESSEECLAVQNGAAANGSRLTGEDYAGCNSGTKYANQYWQALYISDGYYILINLHATLVNGAYWVAAVSGNSKSTGAPVVLWQWSPPNTSREWGVLSP
jgi:hypothetical protein